MAGPWLCEESPTPTDAFVPPELHDVDVQARSSHWGSPDERRAYVHDEVQRTLAQRRGGPPDPDEVFVVEHALEGASRQQDAANHQAACDALDRRDLMALDSELAKERMRRLGGAQLNAYPLLQMHAAIAGVLEPYFPFIELVATLVPGVGELVAVYEAIEGETLVTSQPLGDAERIVGVVLAAAPMAASVAAAGPEAVAAVAAAIARRTGTSSRGALELVRGLARVEPAEARLLLRAAHGERLTAAERELGRRALRDLKVGQGALPRGAAFNDAEIFAHYVEESPARPTMEDPVHDELRVTDARGAGAAAKPYHHIFPQEMRDRFAELGLDIDDFTVQLEQAHHEAIHGGGNWKLARAWPDEWNSAIWNRIQREEARVQRESGKRLTKEQVLSIGRRMMKSYRVSGELVRYPRAAMRSKP
jgi:predicted lipoprotein DUF2380/putative toxin of predicted polymorphic toxin system